MAPRLTVEQRRLARRLSAEGWSLREIGRQVACSHEAVRLVLEEKQTHGVKAHSWAPAAGRLGMAEREEISLGLHREEAFTAIAGRPGRAASTVSREGWRHGGRPMRSRAACASSSPTIR